MRADRRSRLPPVADAEASIGGRESVDGGGAIVR